MKMMERCIEVEVVEDCTEVKCADDGALYGGGDGGGLQRRCREGRSLASRSTAPPSPASP